DQEKATGNETLVAPLVGISKVVLGTGGVGTGISKVNAKDLLPEALTAFTLRLYRPDAAVLLATINILDPAGVTGLVRKTALAPEGSPLKLKVTGLLYPPIEPIFIR